MYCLYCYGTEGLWAFPVISLPNFILPVCIIFILSGQDAKNSNNNSSSSTVTKKSRYTSGIMSLNNEHSIFSFKGILHSRVFLVPQLAKNLPTMWETCFPSWVGKIPWRRKGYPLQCSGLENSMDSIVHGVTKNQTLLDDFHFHSILDFQGLRMLA